MKLLSAAAILTLAALGAVAEAGSLPQPTTQVQQQQKADAHFTHHVRGDNRKLPAPKRISVDQPVSFRFTHYVRGN
jgi:hypothetical protein